MRYRIISLVLNLSISLVFILLLAFSFQCSTKDGDTNKETSSGNKDNTTTNDSDIISKDISAKESYDMINKNKDNPDFILIDVRTPGEYNSGHIANSTLIDFLSPSFEDNINKLEKNKTYLIYCRSGNRSASALKTMKELGFDNVYNMLGGIILWEKESYPTEK